MVYLSEKSVYTSFYVFCLLFAFLMTMWASLEYLKNEDVIEISYRQFDPSEEDSQYPTISLCFVDAYKQSSFVEEDKINVTSYSKFINGDLWDETFLDVDYDDVTIDINDYIINTCMVTAMSKNCHKINMIHPIVFPSPLGVLKCFSFHHIIGLQYKFAEETFDRKTRVKLDEVMIAMNNSIFPNGIRPSSGRFLIMFHYPFQLVRSIYTTFFDWPSRVNSSSRYYSMQFYIRAVETLKRRQNGNQECYDWKQFDSNTIKDVIRGVGCRPPYWKLEPNYPSCNTSMQMKSIALQYQAKLYQDDKFQKVVPPCVEVKKMDVEFQEQAGDESKDGFSNDFYDQSANIAGSKNNWFTVHLHFWSSIDFKKIKQIRAYPLTNMLGNASGYIGFLVGISISQLPYLIVWLYAKLKIWWDYFRKYLGCSIHEEENTEVKYQIISEQNLGEDEEPNHVAPLKEYMNEVEIRIYEKLSKVQRNVHDHLDKKISELTKYASIPNQPIPEKPKK